MWFLTRWLPHSLLFWFWNGRTAVSWRHVEASCGCKKCRWPLGRFQGWLHYSVCFFSWYRRLATIFYLFQQLDLWRNFFLAPHFPQKMPVHVGIRHLQFQQIGRPSGICWHSISTSRNATTDETRVENRLTWTKEPKEDILMTSMVQRRTSWKPSPICLRHGQLYHRQTVGVSNGSTDSICCSGVNGLT